MQKPQMNSSPSKSIHRTVGNYWFQKREFSFESQIEYWTVFHRTDKKRYTFKTTVASEASKIGSSGRNLRVRNNKQSNQLLLNEIKSLKLISSSSTLKCHKVLKTRQSTYFVYDYYPKRSLDYLLRHEFLSTERKESLMRELVKVVRKIHLKRKCVLINLSPENVFVNDEEKVVLGNLFVVHKLSETQKVQICEQDIPETPFLAPQIGPNQWIDKSVDVFSLGRIFEVLRVFSDLKAAQLSGKQMIAQMTSEKAFLRPTIEEIDKMINYDESKVQAVSDNPRSSSFYSSRVCEQSFRTAAKTALSPKSTKGSQIESVPYRKRENEDTVWIEEVQSEESIVEAELDLNKIRSKASICQNLSSGSKGELRKIESERQIAKKKLSVQLESKPTCTGKNLFSPKYVCPKNHTKFFRFGHLSIHPLIFGKNLVLFLDSMADFCSEEGGIVLELLLLKNAFNQNQRVLELIEKEVEEYGSQEKLQTLRSNEEAQTERLSVKLRQCQRKLSEEYEVCSGLERQFKANKISDSLYNQQISEFTRNVLQGVKQSVSSKGNIQMMKDRQSKSTKASVCSESYLEGDLSEFTTEDQERIFKCHLLLKRLHHRSFERFFELKMEKNGVSLWKQPFIELQRKLGLKFWMKSIEESHSVARL